MKVEYQKNKIIIFIEGNSRDDTIDASSQEHNYAYTAYNIICRSIVIIILIFLMHSARIM